MDPDFLQRARSDIEAFQVEPVQSAENLQGKLKSGEPLNFPFLSNLDLSGADLQGADLSGVIFNGIDLCGARMQGCNLSGALLVNCNLAGADLTRAHLNDSQFRCEEIPEYDPAKVQAPLFEDSLPPFFRDHIRSAHSPAGFSMVRVRH